MDNKHATFAVSLRVSVRLLGARDALAILLEVDNDLLWGGEAIGATLEPLWRDDIRSLHVRVCGVFAFQMALFAIFSVCLANGADGGVASRVLDVALVLCPVFFLFLEWLEHRGQDAGSTLQSAGSILPNGFDMGDSLSAVLAAGCAVAHASGSADRDALLTSSAVAALFLLLKAIALLRGFPTLANLVMLLVQTMRDMRPFACILSALLFFLTLAFMLLFADAREHGEFDGEFDDG